ncbi:MAG: BMP family ABC transporter substrate-binding protein, partial [Spirochaetaceae bacterium]|nr:BMP family ABC transporter substrate-binding protein [Spirochaetaceae bacterium]
MRKYPFTVLFFLYFLAIAGCKEEFIWNPGVPLPIEKIKIAVILPNEIGSNSLYDKAHYSGILEMKNNIGLDENQIICKSNIFDAEPAQAEAAIRESIAEGANIIIALS